MKLLALRFYPALALLWVAGYSAGETGCNADPPASVTPASVPEDAPAAGNVRFITLPHFEPELPAAPGREAFVMACNSCHSPRYVTMQPLFPRRQWEETVSKMSKVYGAPIGQEQVREIVDYLVVLNAETPAGAASDSEPNVVQASTTLERAQATPLFAAAQPQEHAADIQRGAALFAQNCAACHGPQGRGDGIVGQILLPKPEHLDAAQFSIELLSQTLWNGVPGTAMPSWRSLPERDLRGLVAYVQTLHQETVTSNGPPETLERGRTLFFQVCAACHGMLGDGKSAIAATLARRPENLRWKKPDSDYVLQVLRNGIPGTAMPSWKDQLSEPDRMALALFVRSLYGPAKPDLR